MARGQFDRSHTQVIEYALNIKKRPEYLFSGSKPLRRCSTCIQSIQHIETAFERCSSLSSTVSSSCDQHGIHGHIEHPPIAEAPALLALPESVMDIIEERMQKMLVVDMHAMGLSLAFGGSRRCCQSTRR